MACLGDAIPRPTLALIGSALTLAGASLVAVPYGMLATIPLLLIGVPVLMRGSLIPLDADLTEKQKFLGSGLVTLGAICLLLGCVMASGLTMDELVASKRGQSYSAKGSDLEVTLVFCIAALVFFAHGDRVRAKSPWSGTLLRLLYWFLHFPGAAVAARIVAATGVPLTA